jgi:hypothetical protein|tara:strand:+ start:392 stop:664 length:273 start_codon:yes stop_codon:yes gene_type:complete
MIDFRKEGRGARNGIRTRDLNLGKVALYQLSYSRIQDLQSRKKDAESQPFFVVTDSGVSRRMILAPFSENFMALDPFGWQRFRNPQNCSF